MRNAGWRIGCASLLNRRAKLRKVRFPPVGERAEAAMTIKTILASVSTPEVSRSTLEVAFRIASRFDAHIDVLHVRADPRGLVPYTGEGMDGSMIEEIMEVTEREGSERAARTRQLFDAFCGEHGLAIADSPTPPATPASSIAWRAEIGREDEVIAMRGRLYDLVVVGRPLRDAPLPSPITLEAALLDTGRPVVVAPPDAPPVTGAAIAIAWEGSPEAARAIADSMPLLERAERVIVLACRTAQVAQIEPEELVARLAWRGIRAEVRNFEAGAGELGPAFLENARAVAADMLIKGAYSQSRLRQLILGGRTRHILAHTTMPVLLAR